MQIIRRTSVLLISAAILGCVHLALADTQTSDCAKVLYEEYKDSSTAFGKSGAFTGEILTKQVELSTYGYVVIGDSGVYVPYSYQFGPLEWDPRAIEKMGDEEPLYQVHYLQQRIEQVQLDSKQFFVRGAIQLKKQWNKHCVPLQQEKFQTLTKADWDFNFTSEGAIQLANYVPPSCNARAKFDFDEYVDSELRMYFTEKAIDGYAEAGLTAVSENDENAFVSDLISVRRTQNGKCAVDWKRITQKYIRTDGRNYSGIEFKEPLNCKKAAKQIKKVIAHWDQCSDRY